jgi:hypothetical protein
MALVKDKLRELGVLFAAEQDITLLTQAGNIPAAVKQVMTNYIRMSSNYRVDPDSLSNAEIGDRIEQVDAQVKRIIKDGVGQDDLPEFQHLASAKECWDVLEHLYGAHDANNLQAKIDTFQKTTYQTCGCDMKKYLATKLRLKNELALLGHTMSQKLLVSDVVAKATEQGRFPYERRILFNKLHTEGDNIKWQHVRDELLRAEKEAHAALEAPAPKEREEKAQPQEEEKTNVVPEGVVMVTLADLKAFTRRGGGGGGHGGGGGGGRRGGGNNGGGRGNNGGGRGGETRTCFYCDKVGHIKSACKKWARDQKQEEDENL